MARLIAATPRLGRDALRDALDRLEPPCYGKSVVSIKHNKFEEKDSSSLYVAPTPQIVGEGVYVFLNELVHVRNNVQLLLLATRGFSEEESRRYKRNLPFPNMPKTFSEFIEQRQRKGRIKEHPKRRTKVRRKNLAASALPRHVPCKHFK